MFDLRGVAALAACAVVVAPVRAQTPRLPQDSLLRVVLARDSVLAVHARAVDSVRRSLARGVPAIEVADGPLRVRTQRELAPRVRLAVDSVSTLIERRGGRSIVRRLAARTPTITRDSIRRALGVTRMIMLASDTIRGWSVARHRVADNASVTELTTALTRLVEQIAFEGVDSTLSRWAMMGRLPLAAPTAIELSDLYTQMATTEAAVLRRCRAGEDPACIDALEVDVVTDGRISRWYAPSDYRSLLRSVAPPRDDSVAVAAWIRCRERRDESACRVAASSLREDDIPLALSPSARLHFLREVLDAGGPGSFDRLMTTSGTLRARFEAASGEPVERTVRRWLGRIDRSRPEPMRITPGLALVSLGWSGGLIALAINRRPTWP